MQLTIFRNPVMAIYSHQFCSFKSWNKIVFCKKGKKAENALEDVALVAGTWQNLSNLYSLDIYATGWKILISKTSRLFTRFQKLRHSCSWPFFVMPSWQFIHTSFVVSNREIKLFSARTIFFKLPSPQFRNNYFILNPGETRLGSHKVVLQSIVIKKA